MSWIQRILDPRRSRLRKERMRGMRAAAREMRARNQLHLNQRDRRIRRLESEISSLNSQIDSAFTRHRREIKATESRVDLRLKDLALRSAALDQREKALDQWEEDLISSVQGANQAQLVFQSTVDLLRRTAGVASASEDSVRKLLPMASRKKPASLK